MKREAPLEEDCMTRYFTVYSWTVKPGVDKEFATAWREFANWITRQEGSLGSSRLFRDLGDSAHFLSVDSWASGKSLDTVRATEEFGKQIDALRKLLQDFNSWPLRLEAETRSQATAKA